LDLWLSTICLDRRREVLDLIGVAAAAGTGNDAPFAPMPPPRCKLSRPNARPIHSH
jgi:hypothetical protein